MHEIDGDNEIQDLLKHDSEDRLKADAWAQLNVQKRLEDAERKLKTKEKQEAKKEKEEAKKMRKAEKEEAKKLKPAKKTGLKGEKPAKKALTAWEIHLKNAHSRAYHKERNYCERKLGSI